MAYGLLLMVCTHVFRWHYLQDITVCLETKYSSRILPQITLYCLKYWTDKGISLR